MIHAYRLESFFIMVLSERITPYTSFASSSNGSAFPPVWVVVEGLLTSGSSSFKATRIPELETRVFLGLLNAVIGGGTVDEPSFKVTGA